MKSELSNIIAAIIILTIVSSLHQIIFKNNYYFLLVALISSIIVISVYIISRKIMAHSFDVSVEHEILKWQRYGFAAHRHLKNPIPAGIVFPIVISFLTLGFVKLTTLLSYETQAKKYRAAKRFGYYSFVELTDWENAIIGAASIIALLILGAIGYILPLPEAQITAKIAVYYAFWNMLPLSKLDGAQIFFGSRILWLALAIMTMIATFYALIL